MKRKWKDSRGETLVEVLASILIGTLSAALLFGTVLASVNIGRTAKAADEAFGTSLKAAERQTDVTGNDVIKIAVKRLGDGITDEKDVSGNFYGGKEAWSFALPSGASVTPP